jgi:ABC-type branched-subunit amino acid transport system ATPase component/ABC-type branched-subunit amino acid transport system permease subunit
MSRLAGVADRIAPIRSHPLWGPLASLAVAYVVLVELAAQFAFGRVDVGFAEIGLGQLVIPREVFLLGAILGTLYGLIGMGLILVYRANRVINFAQAQLGAVPAVFALLLVAFEGWNYFVVLVIAVVGAILLGAGVERTVVRRFAAAPRLILTVATIGIGFLLLFGEFIVKQVVSGDLIGTVTTEFPTPWDSVRFRLGTAIVTGDHFFTVFVVAGCVLGLTAFFRYTDIGIAVRASAENADRASLVGIPVQRVSTVVWVIAAVLSSLGVFLRAPILGVPLTGFTGPTVLLFGLATAVMARMDSFGRCLAAGMFIGIVDRAAAFGTGSASLANAAMLVVILGALLVQRGTLSRAMESGQSSWQAVKEFRPVPLELRDLPEIRRARLAMKVVVGALVLFAPMLVGRFQTGLLTQMVVYAMVGVSLVILTGWSGQISLGQWAISGIGGAVGGGLAANHNLDFFLIVALAGLAGAVAALLVGLPALRVQGLFLAVTTLAFASTVENFVLRDTYFGWLLPEESSFVELPALYGAFDLSTDTTFGPISLHGPSKVYFVTLVFLGLAMLVAQSVRRSRSGRLFVGARDNGRVLQAFGIHLARTRLAAFSLSGFIAGVAGALFVYQQSSVDAASFRAEESILIFSMTVIGGISSLPGAVLGAVFVKGVPLLPVLRDIENVELLSSGLGLLVVLVILPGGLAEGCYRIRDAYLRRVARRRDIHVPSLVADSLVLDDEASDADLLDEELEVETPAPTHEHVIEVTPPREGALLSVRAMEVAYDRVQVLFGVDLDVLPGECVALLGTNGAGKSTVLKGVCGLQPPIGGTVTFDGQDLTGVDPGTAVRSGIVMVPGGKAVFPTLTVAEHLRVAGWLYRDDSEWCRAATEEVLETFPRLRERLDQMAGNLSGGEQQMLALGMAFIAKPKLLIIDELSLGLAPTIVEQLLHIVRRIQASGTALLLVEQSINVALTVADRAYFLEKGEVRFEGPTSELLDRTDIARSVFLSDAGTASSPGAVPARPAPAIDRSGEPILELRDVSISFGGIRAVRDCSFELHRGETLGLVGANGAGKTTLFDLVSGFLVPDHGRIVLDGIDVTDHTPDARAWLGLGRSFQDARLVGSLTVAENIALSLERHLDERDHIAAALRLPGIVDLERDIAWTVDDLVELLHLGAYRDKFVRELSTGSRRIVDLAMCIAHEPAVLLLDEPSSGIAQRETEAMAPLFQRIRDETGASLLIIEHDMPLITTVSDRLLALELGHPLLTGTPDEVLSDPRVQASYLGGDPATIDRSGGARSGGSSGRRRRAPLVAGGSQP